ncbi:MAG: 16S rRNA (cytosine(967)-C(5))-methyltransferase RsmB [Pseudomonadota bacterium]
MNSETSTAASSRAVAARAVLRVFAGKSFDDAFAKADLADARDLAFAKTLTYGVLREHSALSWLLTRLLSAPLLPTSAVHALLCVGLYQLRTLNTAAHAAVSATVDAVEPLGEAKARGLVNAILRRYQRESVKLEDELPTALTTRYSHPAWLVEKIHADWGKQTVEVLAANNTQAPLTLRVNARQITREDYLAKLAVEGIAASAVPHAPDAVSLHEAVGVERIPGFSSGMVSVQDASAQLAAALLDVQDGMRVLDACAAPGGKSAHLLEMADVELTAIDSDGLRLARVRDTLSRLALDATLIEADAALVPWWIGRVKNGGDFDRILLDAPCSGTGVIRRHPDIKWLRREDDIRRLASTQLKLLRALWTTLAPGGMLLYATCSILRAEGEELVQTFLAETDDAVEMKIIASWGEACVAGRRIAPGGDFDGFYYARLSKRA